MRINLKEKSGRQGDRYSGRRDRWGNEHSGKKCGPAGWGKFAFATKRGSWTDLVSCGLLWGGEERGRGAGTQGKEDGVEKLAGKYRKRP